MKKTGLWFYLTLTLIVSMIVVLSGITIATHIYNNSRCDVYDLNSDKEVNALDLLILQKYIINNHLDVTTDDEGNVEVIVNR